MPVQVIGIVTTTYPEVITQDLRVHGQVVIGDVIPVGPVQRGIGGGQRLIEGGIIRIVFFQRLTVRLLDFQEILAT